MLAKVLFVTLAVFTTPADVTSFSIRSNDDMFCEFESTDGFALYGYNTRILYDNTLEGCKTECLSDDNCLSFDYKSNTGSCFLSNESKDTQPQSFGKHSRSTYYHKVCVDTDDNEDGDDDDDHDLSGSGSGSDFSGSGEENLCVDAIGPFGSNGGSAFDDKEKLIYGPITGILVNTGSLVSCVGFIRGEEKYCYGTRFGDQTEYEIQFEAGEYIIEVSGRVGDVLDQITFTTNRRTLGPYGGSGGTHFSAENDGRPLVYMSGRNGDLVDQLTFHFYCAHS